MRSTSEHVQTARTAVYLHSCVGLDTCLSRQRAHNQHMSELWNLDHTSPLDSVIGREAKEQRRNAESDSYGTGRNGLIVETRRGADSSKLSREEGREGAWKERNKERHTHSHSCCSGAHLSGELHLS
jgi:hypothetical protein